MVPKKRTPIFNENGLPRNWMLDHCLESSLNQASSAKADIWKLLPKKRPFAAPMLITVCELHCQTPKFSSIEHFRASCSDPHEHVELMLSTLRAARARMNMHFGCWAVLKGPRSPCSVQDPIHGMDLLTYCCFHSNWWWQGFRVLMISRLFFQLIINPAALTNLWEQKFGEQPEQFWVFVCLLKESFCFFLIQCRLAKISKSSNFLNSSIA
jgi:hypothetical protein